MSNCCPEVGSLGSARLTPAPDSRVAVVPAEMLESYFANQGLR